MAAQSACAPAGSSPLTRGKPGRDRDSRCRRGLIPAHAGKTRSAPKPSTACAAHPRSRGENRGCRRRSCCALGSSPLTRGKLPVLRLELASAGLIPAHAGKTGAGLRVGEGHRAHPRSRGENAVARNFSIHRLGSSPLTRGKLAGGNAETFKSGLIPAHAGKTLPDLRFYCADRSDLGNP